MIFLAPMPLQQELCKNWSNYTQSGSLRVAVGTYNINGGKHFRSVVYKNVSFDDWLLDSWKSNNNGKIEKLMQYLILFCRSCQSKF